MLCLYDIHTHHNSSTQSAVYRVKSLVNTSPFNFDNIIHQGKGEVFSCGIHPWYSSDYDIQLTKLDEIVKNETVLAVGESGLDKLKGLDVNIQSYIFQHHIRLSEEYQKPLIIHCVKAWDELIAIHKKVRPTMDWIIHGFRGNVQQANQLLSHGFKLSIGERYNEDAVKTMPISSLFCETDMSSLPIYQIYEQVAKTRNMSFDELCVAIDDNVKKVFCKL